MDHLQCVLVIESVIWMQTQWVMYSVCGQELGGGKVTQTEGDKQIEVSYI